MFWKKSDDFNFDDPSMNMNDVGLTDPIADPTQGTNLGLNSNNTGIPDGFSDSVNAPMSLHEKAQMKSFEAQQQMPSSSSGSRDFELISSKLDTIKAELDAMSQRLQKIEKLVDKEKEERKPLW